MDVKCVICETNGQRLRNDQDESATRFSALACGHVFHTPCVGKLLKNPRPPCPICHIVVDENPKNAPIRLFLELEGLEASSYDAAPRTNRKDDLNELKRLKEKFSSLKKALDSLKKERVALNSSIETMEHQLSITKRQHRYDLQETNRLRTQRNKLQRQLQSAVAFTDGSVQEAEVNDLLGKSQLALLCITYKKDRKNLAEKLKETSESLNKCERENRLLRFELNKTASELNNLKSFTEQ